MRSTERPRAAPRPLRRLAAIALAALPALLAACSSAPKPPPPAAAPASAKPAASAAQADAAKPGTKDAAGPRAESTEGAVRPGVQRAYEAALDELNGGRKDDAARDLQALARSEPDLGGPHANLGLIYRQEGKLPESVTELEQAVKLNPQQPVFWNQLGITYRLSGDFKKARDAYERAIALDPSYANPYLNLGVLFDLYFWDSQRALELYDRFLALSPGDERVTKWVADLKNRNRKADAAAPKER
jgi:tetratricopeptide (TPR) repeat protein